jgi:alpha-tubulin suppressor-like RCC1 family protein
VSFGWGHALAKTEDGNLFGWGYSADARLGKVGNSFETSPLDSNAGISENRGQLSSSTFEEEHMPIVWEPCLVEELHGVEVVDIACGLDHSLVLCRK